MKKIMFNDRYGLTQAVIEGEKTTTRRLACKPQYKVGEIVAVAQRYSSFVKPSDWDATDDLAHTKGWINKMYVRAELMPHQIRITGVRAERLQDIGDRDCLKDGIYSETVETDYFHYHDPENNYYCAECEEKGRERLIDEALKNKGRFGFDGMDEEWIRQEMNGYSSDDPHESAKICDICGKYLSGYKYPNDSNVFYDPNEAFASLIDKVSGKGTWERNPWVWVYEFELVK